MIIIGAVHCVAPLTIIQMGLGKGNRKMKAEDIKSKARMIGCISDAIELIAYPHCWTKDTGARDANGLPVKSRSDKACRWCATGALIRYSDEWQISGAEMNMWENYFTRNLGASLMQVNDSQGRQAAIKYLQRMRREIVKLLKTL